MTYLQLQVSKMTKDLDKETQDWQKKWEVNNEELLVISRSHEQMQNEVAKVHENLLKMTQLYYQLEKEKHGLLQKLGRQPSIQAPADKK